MPLISTGRSPGSGLFARAPGRRLLQRGTQGPDLVTGKSRAARCALLVAALLLAAALPSAARAGEPCPAPQGFDVPLPVALGPGLWRVEARRVGADSDTAQLVLAADGPRLWLVGSGPTPAFGAALACAVRAGLGQSVTDVLNPRTHPETALANIAFDGARLWALADVAQAMTALCPVCLQRLKAELGEAGASLEPQAIRVPTQAVALPDAGPFEAWALARAADARTLVLRHRSGALLIAPGLVWPGAIPDLRDTDSTLLLASLRTLRTLAGADTVVMGDQGAPGNARDIERHIAYLVALQADVQRRVDAGELEAAGAAELPASARPHAALHALNRQRVWRETEARFFGR